MVGDTAIWYGRAKYAILYETTNVTFYTDDLFTLYTKNYNWVWSTWRLRLAMVVSLPTVLFLFYAWTIAEGEPDRYLFVVCSLIGAKICTHSEIISEGSLSMSAER